jgi:hypothetical protein
MNLENTNDRLNIDVYINNICDKYPENEDDFIFFIRGKISTDEFFHASVSTSYNLFKVLLSLYFQNEQMKEVINNLIIAIEKTNQNL